MVRPTGSFNLGSLRDRIRQVLADGPRTAQELSVLLNEPVVRIQNTCNNGTREGHFVAERGHTRYSLPGEEKKVDLSKPRSWCQI